MRKIIFVFLALYLCFAGAVISAQEESELTISLISFDGANHKNIESEEVGFIAKNYFIPEEKALELTSNNTLATYFIKINCSVNVENLILKDAFVYAKNANETEVWPSWLLLISSGGFQQPLTMGTEWTDGFWVKVNIENQTDEQIEQRIYATDFICEMSFEDSYGNEVSLEFPIDVTSGSRVVYEADNLYQCEFNQYMYVPVDAGYANIIDNTMGVSVEYEDILKHAENYQLIYLFGEEYLKTPTPIYNLEGKGQNKDHTVWYRTLFPGQYYVMPENSYHQYYDVVEQKKRTIVAVVLMRADIESYEDELSKMGIQIAFSTDGLADENGRIIAAGQAYTIATNIGDVEEIPYDEELFLSTIRNQ